MEWTGINNENEYYSDVYKKMPKVGSEVSTPEGKGHVVSNNMLKLIVRVKIEKDGALVYKDFPLDKIRFKNKNKENEERGEEQDPEIKKLQD